MKRKVIASFFAIMIFATLFSVCFAEGYAFSVVSEADKYSAYKGDSFTASFYVSDISHEGGMLGLDARILYDPSHIKLESVEGIFPSEWGTDGFMMHTEEDVNDKRAINIMSLYDGNNIDKIPSARDDKTFGIILKFTVITSAEMDTTITVPNETLSGTSGIVSGTSSIESIDGLGTKCKIALNKTELSSEEESSVASEETTTSNEGSADVSDENVSSTTSEVTSENGSEEVLSSVEGVETSSSNDSSDDKNEKDGVNVILWFVIAAIAVSVIAVAIYIVKNKKDDMNPVNPG